MSTRVSALAGTGEAVPVIMHCVNSATLPRPHRAQSLGEEIANSVSHGGALLLAIAALPVLVESAVDRGDVVGIVAAAIFGTTMIFLYFTSTLYHALPEGRAKHVFRVLDHAAIYLLIAGTYTPFTLGVLKGSWGWTMFGVIWGLAFAGVLLKAVAGPRFPVASLLLYLAMGWLALVAAEPLFTQVPNDGLLWILAGGLAYTLGVPFFAADQRIRYGHFLWHLFVMAGTLCHFVAVLHYAGGVPA
jgi:hemolysin III